MIVSFVIPFYNGGKYFEECLNSIYHQDIPETDYEVIVADDCSTDESSLEILHACQKKYSNLKVIRNEQNLRVGASRNHGIREAKGEYIWFVDQDDKIEHNCLSGLLAILQNEQLDYITFDFLDFDDEGNEQPHQLVTNDTPVMSGLEYAYKICNKQIWNNQWDTNVWHQIYNRDFMLKHNIFFTEVSYFDDMIVNLKSLMYAQRMKAIPKAYYHYRYNEQSVLHTEVGIGGRTLFDASINAGAVLMDFSEEIKNVDTWFSGHFFEAGEWRINTFTKKLLRISHKQQKVFYKQVKMNPGVVKRVKSHLSFVNRCLINMPIVACIGHIIMRMLSK